MAAVATDATVATDAVRDTAVSQAERSTQRLFDPGGPTLEDMVVAAWEDLVADGRAECPVCGGAMSLLDGCADCGSDLS